MIRRAVFWLHLSVGCAAGAVILIMSLTGIGLAFERQINNGIDRAGRQAVQPGPQRIALRKLIDQFSTGGAAPSSVTVRSQRDEPVALAFGRERTLFIDPYSGRVLGESSQASRRFFAGLERWHRALGAELRARNAVGRSVADAANFLFLFLLVSGLYLWWPRVWSVARLQRTTMIRRDAAGPAAWWNYHNVAGIWCALPLLVIVLTGVIMSYSWANDLLYRATGSTPPSGPEGVRQEQAGRTRAHRREQSGELFDLDAAFAQAEQQVRGWRSVTLRWDPGSPALVFTVDRGNGGEPEKRAQLTLDAKTGATRRWEPFASYSAGRRLRAWARFAHTGEAAGLPGQILATLATAGGCVLVITGLLMAVNRLRRNLSNRQSRRNLSEQLTGAR